MAVAGSGFMVLGVSLKKNLPQLIEIRTICFLTDISEMGFDRVGTQIEFLGLMLKHQVSKLRSVTQPMIHISLVMAITVEIRCFLKQEIHWMDVYMLSMPTHLTHKFTILRREALLVQSQFVASNIFWGTLYRLVLFCIQIKPIMFMLMSLTQMAMTFIGALR